MTPDTVEDKLIDALNAGPVVARETLLYKAVAPKIRRQDRKEFARMLQLAFDAQIAPWLWGLGDEDSIYHAFDWAQTPQGFDYWETLDDLLKEYDA